MPTGQSRAQQVWDQTTGRSVVTDRASPCQGLHIWGEYLQLKATTFFLSSTFSSQWKTIVLKKPTINQIKPTQTPRQELSSCSGKYRPPEKPNGKMLSLVRWCSTSIQLKGKDPTRTLPYVKIKKKPKKDLKRAKKQTHIEISHSNSLTCVCALLFMFQQVTDCEHYLLLFVILKFQLHVPMSTGLHDSRSCQNNRIKLGVGGKAAVKGSSHAEDQAFLLSALELPFASLRN